MDNSPMEFLHALINLYGLLQINDPDGAKLDERGRVLLKALLDSATEKLLQTHSPFLIIGAAESNTPCFSQSLRNSEPPFRPPCPGGIPASNPESNPQKRCRNCQRRILNSQSSTARDDDGNHGGGPSEPKQSNGNLSNVSSTSVAGDGGGLPSQSGSKFPIPANRSSVSKVAGSTDEDAESLPASQSCRVGGNVNVKDMVGRIESLSRAPSRLSGDSRYVRRLRVPQSRCEDTAEGVPLHAATVKSRPSVLPTQQPAGSGRKVNKRVAPAAGLSRRPFLAPTLLDYYETAEDSESGTTERRRRAGGPQQEEQISSSSSGGTPADSDSWTTDRRGSSENSSSIYASPPGRSKKLASSYESSSCTEDESGRSCSSRSSSFSSSSSRPYSNGGSSRSTNRSSSSPLSSSRDHRSRRTGRLRRFKDKLGLIFHHHHHHHHHNAAGDDGDRGRKRGKPAPSSSSMWKHLDKLVVFHHHQHRRRSRSRTEEKTNQKREKEKRAVVRSKKKEQMGHFHSLVEGLMRHRRNNSKKKSKTPLPSKLRHGGGVVRVGRGGRRHGKVKLGFMSKKSLPPKAPRD